MPDSFTIAILGCAGRMGRMLLAETLRTEGCKLAAGTDREGSPCLGQDLGILGGGEPLGLKAGSDTEAAFKAADALIDFTAPAATLHHAALAAAHGKILVVGTTGLKPEDRAKLDEAARKTLIVHSANMSVGVNLLAALVEQAASRLRADYDIEIFEAHHKHKVDAPSGTALALGRAAADGRKVKLEDEAVYAREGQTGARVPGKIGFSVARGGDIVGDHIVMFCGEGERIELAHKASSRRIYAAGALRAALWAAQKKKAGTTSGLFSMKDVLGV